MLSAMSSNAFVPSFLAGGWAIDWKVPPYTLASVSLSDTSSH